MHEVVRDEVSCGKAFEGPLALLWLIKGTKQARNQSEMIGQSRKGLASFRVFQLHISGSCYAGMVWRITCKRNRLIFQTLKAEFYQLRVGIVYIYSNKAFLLSMSNMI